MLLLQYFASPAPLGELSSLPPLSLSTRMIEFLMVCNKAGAVRVSRSYTTKPLPEPRGVLHACLKRNTPQQVQWEH